MVEKIRTGDEDEDGRLEQIKPTSIGIFGAQGHFGRSLTARLSEIKPAYANIKGTVDKGHNLELATASDLVVIAVQPQSVTRLLTDIKSSLKADAQVLSFAAGVQMRTIADTARRPVA